MIKCPICLEKMESSRLKPSDGWQEDWTEVKCPLCKNNFKVAVEFEVTINDDFDFETFRAHFDLDKFPPDVSKDDFYKAMRCIIDEKQKELLIGFSNPETKASYEFAMIHHQRVKRTLMPPERKKVS